MSYRWFGAALVIAGCGGFGFSIASGYKREEGILRQLLRALNSMEWELQYRLTPLPELCRQAGKETRGTLREVFFNLARELEWQTSPDAASCMTAALKRSHELPRRIRGIMKQLGHTLGRFDLPGQKQGLEEVREAYAALYLAKSYFYSGLLIKGLTPDAALLNVVAKLPATAFNAVVALIFAPILAVALQKALEENHLTVE